MALPRFTDMRQFRQPAKQITETMQANPPLGDGKAVDDYADRLGTLWVIVVTRALAALLVGFAAMLTNA